MCDLYEKGMVLPTPSPALEQIARRMAAGAAMHAGITEQGNFWERATGKLQRTTRNY